MNGPLAAFTLWQRELVRFFRQPSRIFGALGTPLIFWLVIGSGLSSSFRLPGAAHLDYLEYFYPGTVALIVLFAAIFATISVIEDRHEGFLQGVLVAPVSRGAIVAGKVLGGATLAWLQGAVFLVLAPAVGIHLTLVSALSALGVLAALAVTLTAIGFAFAWALDSTQGYHAVMNVVLIPMWLLSGAFFPLTGAPAWLAVLMRLNPMTYGVAALRWVLYGPAASLGEGLPGPGLSLITTLLAGAVAFGAGLLVTRRGRVG
jgi:ABC-2 type transport system permease protein